MSRNANPTRTHPDADSPSSAGAVGASSWGAARIARRLAVAGHARISPSAAERHAAVTLIVARRRDDLRFLFVRRADVPGDPWSGHMALPGGHRSPSDADLLETARRETREEVGLDLPRRAFLGRLDDLHPVSRRIPSILISPFVAWHDGRDGGGVGGLGDGARVGGGAEAGDGRAPARGGTPERGQAAGMEGGAGGRGDDARVGGGAEAGDGRPSARGGTPDGGRPPDDGIRTNHEVQYHRWVSLADLRDPARRSEIRLTDGGRERVFPSILVEGDAIWGLTYRIVENFLQLIAQEARR